MEKTSSILLPAKDAMLFPVLCISALFIINREDFITRHEAYTAGLVLLTLYLPFSCHSLELSEDELSLRHCILPRRRRFAWEDIARIRFCRHGSGEAVTLTIFPRKGVRRRMTLDLRHPESAGDFAAFLALAQRRLGSEAVAEKRAWLYRVFF